MKYVFTYGLIPRGIWRIEELEFGVGGRELEGWMG
jgi:hypothetical protein